MTGRGLEERHKRGKREAQEVWKRYTRVGKGAEVQWKRGIRACSCFTFSGQNQASVTRLV